jgi:hypothetical protein
VVKDDADPPKLLGLAAEIAAGDLVTLLIKDAVAWDKQRMGASVCLSDEGTVASWAAKSTVEGDSTVLSKEFLKPNTGLHCFEYVYTQSGKGCGGRRMDGCTLVGVVNAMQKESNATDSHCGLSDGWWGLTDAGGICKGDDDLTTFAPEESLNENGVAFGSGDRIGFTIDMSRGVMNFYRNGELIQGAQIKGVPANQPLVLVGCLDIRGSSVRVSVPSGSRRVAMSAGVK